MVLGALLLAGGVAAATGGCRCCYDDHGARHHGRGHGHYRHHGRHHGHGRRHNYGHGRHQNYGHGRGYHGDHQYTSPPHVAVAYPADDFERPAPSAPSISL